MTAKVLMYGVVVLICLASVFGKVLRSRSTVLPGEAVNGAYRDGLYMGDLSAREHRPVRIPVGRWSSQRDRVLFDAGYRRGYSAGRRQK
jgi:hypothetical protein